MTVLVNPIYTVYLLALLFYNYTIFFNRLNLFKWDVTINTIIMRHSN